MIILCFRVKNVMLTFYIILLIFFSSLYFVFLISLVFFYLSGFVSLIFGAPYIPLSKKLILKVLAFGGLSSTDIFYDLGCGDGRLLMSGVYDFNTSKAVGYEIAPWPYLKTKFLIKYNHLKTIDIFRKNFLKANISQATFIYMYLFPKLVNKMAHKISTEGTYKTKILCVEFPIDVDKHIEFKLLKSEKIHNLMVYLYELKPRNPLR